MNRWSRALLLAATAAIACGPEGPGASSSSADSGAPSELAHFPLNDAGVSPGADAIFDPGVSRDGGGSLRVQTDRGGRLRLYELDDLGMIQGEVVYTGFLRSQALAGQAMLELWCRPAEGDEAFVRGAASAVEGDSEWTPQEVRFSDPDRCANPTAIGLNVLIRGAGTVWIDDLRLWSVPVD